MAILGFCCVLRGEIWYSCGGDHRGCGRKNSNPTERQQRNDSDRELIELGPESVRDISGCGEQGLPSCCVCTASEHSSGLGLDCHL